jgi:hypothetical protein
MRMEGQRDMMELTLTFCNFANTYLKMANMLNFKLSLKAPQRKKLDKKCHLTG